MKEPISARDVSQWLQDYAAMLSAVAIQHRIVRTDEALSTAADLETRSAEVQEVAQRLFDQKGEIQDCAYLELLLKDAYVYLANVTRADPFRVIFQTRATLLEAIKTKLVLP